LVAVALVAAALADPIVESIANAGTFGPGYADNTHLGVIPTAVLGAILVLEIAVVRCLDVLRGFTAASRTRFADVASSLGTRSTLTDLPIVFALQIATLYALESGEQLATSGQFAGGLVWLGGPIAFSLIVHAAMGIGLTFALGALLRAIVRAFASVVRTVFALLWTLQRDRSADGRRVGRVDVSFARTQAPNVRQIGGRAPPLLRALA
jgi:hypothetical protein